MLSIPSVYLDFDGTHSYVEIPNRSDFSVSTTGELTVSAWLRPDTLLFPSTEGEGYVYLMGKGTRGQQEWAVRMYSQDNTVDRGNRVSFYVFNLEGGLGVGSYFQDALDPGEWIHLVAVADGERTHIYKNGALRKSDVYAGTITPRAGTAPVRLGTRDFQSYFPGALAGVRFWNRALSASEVGNLYNNGIVPPDGLVAEYLLDGTIATDTAGAHNGTISGATWTSE